MDPEHDAYKQIEVIVSESLLPQEYEMEYCKKVHNSVSMLHSDKPTMLYNDKCTTNGSHLACNSKQ